MHDDPVERTISKAVADAEHVVRRVLEQLGLPPIDHPDVRPVVQRELAAFERQLREVAGSTRMDLSKLDDDELEALERITAKLEQKGGES